MYRATTLRFHSHNMMIGLEEAMNCKLGKFIFLILATFISLTVSFTDIHTQSLLEFKMSVKVDPTLSLSNWVAGTYVCNWTGITCDHKQRVVSLVLKYKHLAGRVSPYIANMSFLTTLDLSNNRFSGVIPQEMGKLEKLQYLKLYANSLQGSIPVSLRACTNLLQLRLNNNLLSGSIPPELSSLHSLKKLILCSNNLTGIIPLELANCSALTFIDLSCNHLTGQIPSKMGALTHLRELDLHTNHLAGEISIELTNCSALTFIDLSFNHLTGQIPSELGDLTHLRVLDLHTNQLSREIPKSLSNCTKLLNLLLYENAFEEPIPSEIFRTLSRLEYLHLQSNKFNSSIPEEIGKLPKLRQLYLGNNLLTGGIPAALANCSSLEVLSLSSNSLYGYIPTELGSLIQLRELSLDHNNLAGSIPSSLMNCTQLRTLDLSHNKLVGKIPNEIGYKLDKLQVMSLAWNQLTGSIPKSVGNCSALCVIDIMYNQLSGVIPGKFRMLTHLQEVHLGSNSFMGDVLPFLLNCSQLRGLGLELNRFEGSIPAEIGFKLTNLQTFTAGRNRFTGGIPKSLGNCSQLSILDLGNNQLSGVVPQELGMLSALQRLYFSSNKLSSGNCATMCVLDVLSNCSILQEIGLGKNHFRGTLSKVIGNLSPRLSHLSLYTNNITGNIPQEIGNLTGLTLLSLFQNNLIGKLPSTLGLLKNLRGLYLSSNKLQGGIPPEFSKLANLSYLDLQENNISGDIPSSVGSLKQLRSLDLSDNALTGMIPNTVGQCFRLEMIDLSYNSLTGNIPLEISSLHSLTFYLNFSHNALTGRLPSLGGMQLIQAIDISANNISGPIPGDIGSCVGLQYLNLANNKLNGIVPISIGKLKSLEGIDLSFNRLSGPVPESIANLTMLRHLNFSYNSLSGSVSNRGAFRKLSVTSFLRNAGLCAASGWLNLPNCTSSGTIHVHSNGFVRKVVWIASVGAFLAFCLVLGALYIFYIKNKRAPIINSLLRGGLMQISREELYRATEGFSAANLLGAGSFGSVYQGLLSDNSLVAVKVFDQDSQNSYKNFYRECRILSKIRHRNLVQVLSSCSTVDFRALVLKFMSKGSLEYHLQEDKTQCRLSLKMRLDIALDVAHGMAYLHHDCSPPVVHCDLKPSNVLMDETMTAHVADFGIARLMMSTDCKSSSTSRLKGTVGYIAPEYGLGGQVTRKGDVYSFGMLILEMVTRKRPTDDMFTGNNMTLPRWVRTAFPEAVKNVVDRGLLVDHDLGEAGSSSTSSGATSGEIESSEHGRCLVSLIEVGLQCTRKNPGERPTMREVERRLEKILYGKGYGNLEEHASVTSLLSAVSNRGAHTTSFSNYESESSYLSSDQT